MQLKQRVLIAARPAAALLLQDMLEGVLELVRVQTIADALVAFQRDIDLIISTVAFDDSRMLELLQSLLPTVLPDASMVRLGQVCTFLGADEFIDLPGLDGLHGANAGKLG